MWNIKLVLKSTCVLLYILNKTSYKPVSWQQQRCPSDLLKSAQCANSWESMQTYLKVRQKLRSMPKVWENVLIAIFAVQMLFLAVQMIFFWCAGKKIWAHSTNFCCVFQEKIFWVCSTHFCRLEAQYKSLLHFSRVGGCKNLSMDTLLLSKIGACMFENKRRQNRIYHQKQYHQKSG